VNSEAEALLFVNWMLLDKTGVIRLVREQYSPSAEEPDTWRANVGCGPAGLQPVAVSTVYC
jgi:hypothetical protein